MAYTGYLSRFADLLIAGHRQGLSAGELAERLYALGARADSSEHGRVLTQQQQLRNLRSMTIYALVRLGQRVRVRRAGRTLTAHRIGTTWEIPPPS